MPFIVLVPTYRPGEALVQLVSELADANLRAIVVVDDGSGPEYAEYFHRIERVANVHVLRHAINLGKGAALKTGFNHVLCSFPDVAGLVTADADGQHAREDIMRVGAELVRHPASVVLGAREFDRSVPLRSRLGNKTTAALVRWLVGQRLSDTQTGLRGIPASLLPSLLRIPLSGYEFELEMLISARRLSYPVRELKIQTIYVDGNRSSHFNPIADSMRIYFILLRFSALSLLTALADNLVFYVALQLTASIVQAQVSGRAVAVLLNYTAARRLVFLSQQRHRAVLPRYLLLVLGSGVLSYSLIHFLTSRLPIGVMTAKVLAEGLIFIANFTIQRDFIFTNRTNRESRPKATNWNEYYRQVPFTARLTRRYTTHVLLESLRRFSRTESDRGQVVIEIGGANSCFLDHIRRVINPQRYYVIDTNEYGLELLRARVEPGTVHLLNESVLDLHSELQADVVFSVGLIEHFSPADTRRAVLAHFALLRPGGHAILTFPTPTLLYRAARRLLELARLWKFPDERPLSRDEVVGAIGEQGDVIFERLLWPLVLTQRLLVVRKRPADV